MPALIDLLFQVRKEPESDTRKAVSSKSASFSGSASPGRVSLCNDTYT